MGARLVVRADFTLSLSLTVAVSRIIGLIAWAVSSSISGFTVSRLAVFCFGLADSPQIFRIRGVRGGVSDRVTCAQSLDEVHFHTVCADARAVVV